jgi:transposase-like protein
MQQTFAHRITMIGFWTRPLPPSNICRLHVPKRCASVDLPAISLAGILTFMRVPEAVRRPLGASATVLSRHGVALASSELGNGHEYAMKSVIKRLRFPLEIMLVCVRWYVAYPLSLRTLEEMMHERGVTVDHSTIHRWTLRLMPVLERTFRKRKAAVGKSWRMDETYVKVGGQWKYLYRAVDKAGNTVDFLLTAKLDRAAAQRFLARAMATVFLRPSRSTRAAPIPPASQAITSTMTRRLRFDNASISATSLSKTTGRSSASSNRCSGSNLSAALASSLVVSRSCT